MQKTVLIIGGTRGIGSEIKRFMLERGDIVYTTSRKKSSESNHFVVDIPDKLGIDKNLKINYLIFTHRYREQNWDNDFKITVKGVEKIIKLLEHSFLNEASIVILGSNAGQFVLDEQSASYHATRAALEGLNKYYAVTLGNRGIRCNCVLPTTIIKPENIDFFTKNNDVRKLIEKITPLGRMGTSNDIAKIVGFLCSTSSSFITGQTFFVDGGISIRGQESIARQILNLKHPNLKLD